jgi:hypothetical protein
MHKAKADEPIPSGQYCYSFSGLYINGIPQITPCPFWSRNSNYPEQGNGYCSYLNRGDWDVKIPSDLPDGFPHSCLSLLWDMCKECGVNLDNEDYDD